MPRASKNEYHSSDGDVAQVTENVHMPVHHLANLQKYRPHFVLDRPLIFGIRHKLRAADLSSVNIIPWETGLGIEATIRHQSSLSALWHRFAKSLEL